MPLTNFRYVPTSGDLPGKSFEEQTERAFNELGVDITNIQDVADNALNIANDAKAAADAAVQTAQNAEQIASQANQTAESAKAAIDNAQASADIAKAAADQAQSTADQALSTSQGAQSTADQAVVLADAAQTTADTAQQGVTDNKTQIEALWSSQYALGGVYETQDDAVDFDLYTLSFKIYATNPGCTGLPGDLSSADFPIFIQGSYNSTNTACFQEVFSSNTPGITYIRTGELSEDPVYGLVETWGEWKAKGGGSGSDLFTGDIRLMPLRPADLPLGWYFANGDRYLTSSPQGQALLSLGSIYWTDWGIATLDPNHDTINVPNLFYGDGRGYFLRTVDGAIRLPGSVQEDTLQNIKSSGGIGARTAFGYGNISPFFSVGAFSHGNGSGSTATAGPTFGFDASLVARTGTETRSLNIGMTPAVYLGV